jgi:hypothetical protein
MAKLKQIIKQLTLHDYEAIYENLVKSGADKSAYLLKSLREKQQTDAKLMQALEVNTNAYYTLRSRLNQKIEEHLLQQMESPRTDLVKKVANITEIIFTKKRAIAITTIKKLEKELLDYDLSNELTIIYKILKRLHSKSPDAFQYSQAYNKHVATMLSLDKAEDLLTEYCRKFGNYMLNGNENEKAELIVLNNEMENMVLLYQSHRLYVYQNFLSILHRLFIVPDDSSPNDKEPIEDILDRIDSIFQQYNSDATYFHLKLVVEFLRTEYHIHYKLYKQAERCFDDINEDIPILVSNYGLYTFSPKFLITKIEMYLRLGKEDKLYAENETMFTDFEIEHDDIPKYAIYMTYRALSCYYASRFDEAVKWLNTLLNETALKKYVYTLLEIKCIQAMLYSCLGETELFNQLISSVQRQLRLMEKSDCYDVMCFMKILKIATSEAKKDKEAKIKVLAAKLNSYKTTRLFSPMRLIRFDNRLIEVLID